MPTEDQLWHSDSAEEAIRKLGANARGLTAAEAASRLLKHGPNALPDARRRPLSAVVLRQFASPLIYILLVAAVTAFLVGEASDAIVILVVVFLNALIGAFQEGRAERSMEALRKLASLQARVLRDGEDQSVAARELVPGDVLLLSAGDAIGADARLLEAAALETAEAALTGESLPISKNADPVPPATPLAERRNMVYSGTHVAAGRGRAVVVATAQKTEVGRIADLTETAKEPATPLELRIAQFGRWLAGASIALFVLILLVGLWRRMPFTEILMVAISQMVSMVPEGLPVAMTIALAIGMQRMAARGAIVRRLSAVETLGSTTVICSDKTGTLTRNEMTVTAIWLPDGRRLEITGAGYSPEGKLLTDGRELAAGDADRLRPLLEAAALCNDAQLVPPDDEDSRWRPLGDPTEAALLTLALKACIDLDSLRHQHPRRLEIPFDADTKMMATQHGRGPHGRICLKGAPEAVAALCADAPREIETVAAEMAGRALRVLAVAQIADGPLDDTAGFEQFAGRATFLGLIGQMDPPRDEVRQAVEECQRAGIRPVMVTGDHKATGLAIAHSLGIARDGDLAFDGQELERMSDEDLRAALGRVSVFARVHPAQKLRIVEAFQARRDVVSMTGDGVNDAPALARADVGVAMGITGTDVAKGAAKIVITDDNFATIVKAIEQGRLVYRNLKKVILFLFATSIDEVAILLLALFAGLPLPLAAVQILWINLVTEGTLTLNFAMEKKEGDEMVRPPIPADEPLITRTMLQRIALMVVASVIATFGWFAWRLHSGTPFAVVQSETFTLLAICQWFNALNCRSETRSALNFDIVRNRWLLGGLILANLLQFAVIYWPPMNRIFHTVPISLSSFFLLGAAGSLVLWGEEVRKFFARRTLASTAAAR